MHMNKVLCEVILKTIVHGNKGFGVLYSLDLKQGIRDDNLPLQYTYFHQNALDELIGGGCISFGFN